MTADSGVKVAWKLRSHHWSIVVLALAIVGIGMSTLLGLPSWLIMFAAAIPFAILTLARFGGAITLVVLAFGEALALLFVLIASSLLRLPMLATVEIAWTLLGAAGSVALWRSEITLKVPGRAPLLTALASASGAVIWLGTLVAARFSPSASHLSWVMRGDAANNILLLRDLIREHGVAVAVGNSPVPLPTAVFAVVAASGRGNLKAGSLLRHDVTALTSTWIFLIALFCVVSGIVAALIAQAAGAPRALVIVTAGGASILPLSWFFTGYPLDFGFLDAVVAVPLVLLSFLAYIVSKRHPHLSLVLLLASGTLLLSVWSPLVLVPALLGVAVLGFSWRSIFDSGRVWRWVMAVFAAQLVAYGLLVALPNVLSIGHLLAHGGAVYNFHRWMVAALAVLVIACGAIACRNWRSPLTVGLFAVAAATGIGLAVLLFIARDQPSPWTYYPVKFAWLCSTVLVVLLVGVASALIARVARWWWLQAAFALLGAAAMSGFLVWTPYAVPGYSAASAISQVTHRARTDTGDAVAERIFRFTASKPVILWHSGDPDEAQINFWALQIRANTLQSKFALRTAAYGNYDHDSVTTLCRIVGLMGVGTTVYSTQSSLQSELDATCPRQGAQVSREPAR